MAKWTKDEMTVAFALYCIIPQPKIKKSNRILQQVCNNFNHSIDSLIMCMQNFAAIDPKSKVKGLVNWGKLHQEVWNEFKNDWGELSVQAEKITNLSLFDADPIRGARHLSALSDRPRVLRERQFFRSVVLASYQETCCVSGLMLPELLVASHIKPYSKCRTANERTTPGNGVLLNTFYDKAFDSGLLTILPDYTIRVSTRINPADSFAKVWLCDLDGEKIKTPTKFRPEREFLEYHNDIIFKR